MLWTVGDWDFSPKVVKYAVIISQEDFNILKLYVQSP